MKKIAAILGSALLAAACSDKPPESPANVTTTGTSMTTTQSPSAANVAPTPASHEGSMQGSSSTTSPAYAESQTTANGSASTGSTTGTSKPSTWGQTASSTTTAQPSIAPAATPTPVAAPTPKADNTKQNVRDRHDTLTPTDQGNSKDETQITASIRKQIVGSKMSFNAKNAKVITQGTKVTLRGPVKTDEEKAQLESLARATAGVTDVDNQLEVKK